MTREEIQEWVKSLKPGDVVIQQVYGNAISALTVKKVTPTGIVKTEDDKSFALPSWGSHMYGRGRTGGKIVPATEELLKMVAEHQKRQEQARHERSTIYSARSKMAYMPDITYDFAVEFLELCKRYGIEA